MALHYLPYPEHEKYSRKDVNSPFKTLHILKLFEEKIKPKLKLDRGKYVDDLEN